MATEPDDPQRQRILEAVEAACEAGGGGLLLPALHAVQDALGHVPPQAVAVLAERFNLSRADVHGVVTFYRDFTSEPASRVRVCRAEACRAMGGEELVVALRTALPARFGDALGEVGDVFCLGNCALGPSASIDGRVVGRATSDRVLAVCEQVTG